MRKAYYKEFEVTAEYKGDKPASWMASNNNRHLVTVRNTDNGKSIEFDFWGSLAHPELKSEYDVLNAFNVLLLDAIRADQSYSGFCRDLGYDDSDDQAEEVYEACREHLEMLESIYDGLSENYS